MNTDDIAVVGMAGRFPDAKNVEEFWANLVGGKNSIKEVPQDRWCWREFWGDPLNEEGKTNSKWGSFLTDVDKFDAQFFGISPKEAELMDPQQRIMMEVCWSCFEDAGITPSALPKRNVGVYLGVFNNDYKELIDPHPECIAAHHATGSATSILSNRISYFFDFVGPSLSIDTACSSSLICIHLAMQAMRAGECELALAGGINLLFTPNRHISFAKTGMLSATGQCYSFDERANGYVRGEGAGVLLLKPLESSLADRNRIYGVIKASAINHGGKAHTLTYPSAESQSEVIYSAIRRAGVSVTQIGYIEAHGTGTPKGDRIEWQALVTAFQKSSASGGQNIDSVQCGVGSVKSNIGHLEAAAGVTGVIKVLLSMKNKTLVGLQNFSKLNPQINLSNCPLFPVVETQHWPKPIDGNGNPCARVAGVSSFGFGGTNAHVVIEEHREALSRRDLSPERLQPHVQQQYLVPLSAKTPERLKVIAENLKQYLDIKLAEDPMSLPLSDVAYTLQVGREAMEARVVFWVVSVSELQEKLALFCEEKLCESNDFYQGYIKQSHVTAPITKTSKLEKASIKPVAVSVNSGLSPEDYKAIAKQWSEGASIDWSILHSGISDEQKPRIIGLPTYPFLKVCHWIKTQPLMEQDTSSKKHVEPVPPLNPLGTDLFKPLWEEISIEPLLQEVPSTESQTVVIGGSPEAYKDLRKYGCSVQSLDIRPDYNIDRIVECLSVHAKIDQVLWVATESTPSELAFKAGQDINLKNIDHLYLLFRIIKALLVLGYGRRALIWSLVTYNGQAVEATDTVDACLAGVHGLVGAMAKEFPSWKVRLLDLETSASYSIDTLFSLPFSEGGKPWIYRRGKWLVQKLAPLIPVESQRPVYRERGVYVVIGGAGGIGEVWSESIIRDYHAQVIWIGRRQRDTAITEKIKRLGEIGLAPLYIQADASDYKSLRDAYRQIKRRFPQVSGVIQSAVGVLDQSLNNMSEKLFRASLSSKVDVSVCVARIFGSEPLDFMLFFSSIVSFSRDHGKSGYAAGCAFEDAFAHQLSCSFPYSVKVMNWGWWGNTGIAAVVPDTFKQRMTRLGILPITRDNGMRALNTLLTANIKQMANVALTKKDAMADLTQEESVLLYQPGFASIHKKISASVKRKSIATSANLDIASLKKNISELDQILYKLLWVELRNSTIFDMDKLIPANAGTYLSGNYSRWIEQTISLLVKANYLDTSDAMRGANSTFAEDREAIWNEWNAKSKSWRRQPDLCARVVLAGATLRELVNILQRKKLATEVIFPNMSMALVEDIYKNNPISDYYNAIVADTVVEFVEQRRHQYEKPCIRILEVGAGTGGTSAVVFEKLKPYQDCIAEYCYSDISKAFTLHAQQTYGPYVPYLSYQIFDVEKPLQAQSVLNGRYDLVIATNVLHATKNIRRTLRNVKATLKNCGVLLLNELSDNTLFLHLTFGLLDGWWLSEDNDLRIPGSPLLSPQSWKAVLESEGFHTEFPAQSVHTLGHQIIIAESDGVVRQRQASPVENDSSKSSRQKIDIERQLPGADSAQQPNMLDGLLREKTTHYFRDLVANTLKFPSADLDDREPLGSYGIDSILVIQLTNDLGKVLENVDSSLFYTYQTIDALVNHFITTQKDTLIKLFGLQGVDDKASNAEIGEHLSTVKPRTIDYQELASKQIDSVDDKKVQNEPIAIIGMSGRFPQAENVDMLWENLKSGKDCIAEIPVNRWPHDGFFLPDKNTAIEEGKSYSKWGGFLDGHRLFDPLFFNISPREAVEIDPQERLFMQSCWETFEDAGYFRQRLMQQHNGRVGIFAGVTRTGFDLFGPELWRQGGSSIPHTSFSSIANRISYFMNFNGPSLPVDTMCSSSLTAVHQACVALQLDECEMAIAGGVNLYLHPSSYIWLCRQQMLSVSGHCSSFGEGGDGFVPGEGVGTLLLKPISRAQADGDPIYALIRGTGINHGGKTHGYSVPNAAAQGSLIRRVLDKAGVDASMVSYVEAHGTGTKLGDPIEVSGLNQAFRVDTSATQYCAMGSIKSNIGHLEAAAGVAGLIKVILQMKHKQIVPSLHSSSLNSNIDFENSPFVVQQETQFWHRPKIIVDGIERKCARIAGVSSFGAGGANAHVVVEEYRPPQAAKEQKFASAEQPVLIILSAKTEIALIARAARLLEAIEKKHLGTKDLLYIAYTLQIGREAMTERLGVVVNSIEDLIEKLSQVINDKPDLDGIYRGTVRQDKDMLQLLAEDEDLQQASISWARKGKYGKLLNFWVRGLNVNWHELYNAVDKPRCIRLPVYPFAGEEYWFPALTSQSPDDRDEVERICASSTISELVNNKNTTLLMRPEWRHQPVTETSGATVFAQHCAILCGVKAEVKESIQHLFNKSIEKIPKIYLHEIRSSSDIDERYQHLTDQVYKTLQDLLKAQLKSKVLIQVLITLPLDSAVTEQALFSGLSGLIKTACKESPNILGQVIEVLSNESANSIVKKITENSYSPYDVDIHYRKGSRWVLDWHRINFSVDYKKNQLCKPWRENGTYLISGGAGGLGIEITEEIVKSINNPKIILTGRTPENETIRFKIEQLKCSNAHVEYQKVDVADTNKVNQLIDDIKQRFGTLNGVIHSAGIVRDNYIYNKDLEEIEQVLAPKVKGVVNLDRATQGIRLDFFIMFSSIAASLGSVAQADYAAANAFLDRYAGYRNRLVDEKLRHGRTLSINWPLWKHGGMQVDVEAKRLMKDSIGIVPMETVDGINAFYQAWSTGLGQVMVLFGDSAIISESVFNSRLANSSEISEAATKLDSVNTSQILPSVVQRLKNIFSTTADIPISRIDGNEPLESYGIDSMMIHRLNRQLESIFGALSKTLFYEYQTLNALGEFLSRDKPMECIKWTGLTQEQINHREKAIKSDNVGNNIPITSSTRLPQSAATLVNDISQDKTAEPIAVIGLSGRYPKSETMALFWQNLQDGSDCITEIPPERWPLEDFFVPDKRQALKQAKSYSKWGGFLSGFAEFDPLFFNISPSEAQGMDPQERQFLECCWAVFEDAGYTKQRLQQQHNGQVGIFVGITKTGFGLHGPDLWRQGETLFPRISFGSVANRISYLLNLRGPSMPIDTMCSASLTAVHEACEHIYRAECELAVAGGVNLYLHPANYIELCAFQMLSVDGQCKSFSEGGNGFVPGEGVGAVLLKPLVLAKRDCDHIYATIRGTSINHGGKTNGYTVPNPVAQGELIRAALDKAGINARTVSYIEAHGTGTELGDPIEITGLQQAFEPDTQDKQFCAIGSIKTNIGHLEAAAGIAGLTKIILQLKHRKLVPSLHASKTNPNIDFKNTPFFLQKNLEEWKRPCIKLNGEEQEFPLRAGISSFGAGGANAHVLVEEHIDSTIIDNDAIERSAVPLLILLSAKSEDRLVCSVQNMIDHLEGCKDLPYCELRNLAFTLQVGREAMEARLAIIVQSCRELLDKLQNFLAGKTVISNLFHGRAQENDDIHTILSIVDETTDVIETLLKDGRYDHIANLWVKGANFEWRKLYKDNHPQCVSLPSYPFRKQRYWIDSKIINSHRNINLIDADKIHPLLHKNVSKFGRQQFVSTFSGRENFFSEHRINGDNVLPGVAHIEMALSAIINSMVDNGDLPLDRYQLKNIVWLRRLIADEKSKKIKIKLEPINDKTVAFNICSVEAAPDDQPVVYSKGSITIESESTAAPKIDLRQTISNCSKDIITAQQCYKIFEDMGMEYGAGHKGIKEILVGRNSVVAKLDLNESDIYEQSKYCLHPGLFDSALQAGVGMLSLQSLSKTLVLPFALESIRVFTKIKNRIWVIVNYSAGSNFDSKLQKLDIDLCDESGVVCVRLKGLSLRKVLPNPQRESFDIVLAEPQWNVSETILQHIDNYSSHIIFFCEVNDSLKDKIEIQLPNSEVIWFTSLSDTIEQRYEDYSVGIFTKIQSLFKKIHLGRVFFQVIIFAEGDRSILSGLVSLLQTANLENSSFIGQLIEVDTEDANDAEHVNTIVLDNARMPEDKLIRHINGKRLVSGWRRFATACHSSDCVFRKCWKNNATYLITGGMGGLGYIFANEITRQIQDVNLILTGRSEIDATIQNKIDYLLSNGANAIYIATDVADKVAVEAMVQKIQTEFGELNGIIHSSGIIEDNLILNKDIAEFKRVLSPKIQGVVNLDQCTRSIALDFFVLFSSVAGCIGNVGQVDYVAANAFLNGFSRYRNSLVERGQRSGRTLSINWPLWKDGGMRVSRETEDMIFRSTGMCAMNSTDGIEAFYAAIESNLEWVMVLYGNAKKIENKIISVSSKTVTDRKEKSIGNVTGVLDREKESKTNSVPALKFKKILEVKLVDIVEKILKIESEFIDFNKEFSSFGFDSIGLTEFSNRINEEFGIELTPMVFYEYPTIGKFIDFLSLEHEDKCSELQLNEADIDLHVIGSEELTSSPPQKNVLNISQISKPEVTPLPAIQALSSDNLESQQSHDSIAVIGISGCFPMAEDIDDFWNVLVEGVDCISEIPSTRWDWREIYGDPHTEVNKCNIKWGGFINKVDVFDPLFFGISPKEALLMDPQQRLLMTHVWKVIEDAGHSPESLAGTRTGIFVGTTSTEYGDLILQSGIAIEGYSASGSVASIGPNRMSYLLDLHGPSEPIETACSSSLVAIHRAVEAMKSGGCMLSIVGGVNTIVTPRLHISFNKAGMLSQDGRCKTFSDQANGYVRGEGVGLIFLKWLSDAEKDGDHIYGLIKGSAENHGGRANSLTAPNQGAQARVIQEAHRAAGVEASSISYIEAHGTGTELGDPIEIEGLKKVFQSSSSENSVSENNEGSLLKHSCGLGSVKSNIGHLELAAGIAGVIKVLLQLKHKTLVKSLHCETINPYINLSNSPLYIVDENRYWMPQKDVQGRDLPRRAGVSSFGFGGVNAHVVIEEYIESTICDRESNSLIGNSLNSPIDSPIHNSAESSKNKQHIIVLSAKNQERLKAQVNNILVFINNNNKNDIDTNLQNLAYTLQVGRVCMESKLAVIVENSQELIDKLGEFSFGKTPIDKLFFSEKKSNAKVLKQEQNKNESDELIHKYMENRRLEKLAELWVNGIVIDWEKMYEGCQPKRISLPTYPFSEEKYWIAAKNSNEEKSQNKFEPRSLHPLLQHNESNFAEQKYSLILTGDEFFLKHHVVKGIKILPGVVYLEMARAAALHAGSWDENSAIILEEVVWLQPVALRSSSKNVKVRLTQVSSQEATYEIYSDCGPGISETTVSEITASETIPSETIPSEKIVYAEGRISKNAMVTPEVVDIDKLKIKCNKGVLPASDCYSLFKTAGLDYGESQQGIQSVYIGEDKVLAKLNLPSVVKDTLAQYTLHPSIMDSALQASFALLTELANLTDTPTLQLALPYSLDKVEVLSSCKQSMWVLIQYSANNIAESPTQKLDLKIFDQKGKVCVRIYGLTSRKPKQFDEAEYYNDSPIHFAPNESVYTHLVTPVWVQLTSSKLISQDKNYPRLGHHGNQSSVVAILGDETSKMRLTTDFSAVSYLNVDATSAVEEIEIALNEIKSIDHIIWVAKLPNSVISGDSIIDAKNNEILPCLRVIKALLALGYESRVLKWTIITFDAVSVDSGEPVDPRYAGVHGLFGSMAKEYTNWSVGVYDLEDESVWPEQNISLWPEPRGGEVLAYRSKQWYCQRLRSIADDKDLLLDKVRSTDPITYRANGVYVVVGGAGGIGCVWTEMMIRKFQAQVVWIGRQKQGTRITEQIIRLSKLGPAPIYIEADAGNRGSLQAAYMEIKQRFERVNGVINAAIVLRDKTLIAMDEKQFKDCIDAKIDTSVSLVEVFQQEKLDFLLFFSSFSSFSKPAGQSNYAVGCCFQDSYAHFLSQKQLCNAKVINWGYWGKVGVVSSASYRQRMKSLGIGSIEHDEAMQALETLLKSSFYQIAFIKTTKKNILNDLLVSEYLMDNENSIPAVIQNIIALKTFSSNLYS